MFRVLTVILVLLLAGCVQDGPGDEPSSDDVVVLRCPGGAAPDACNQRLEGTRVNEFSVAANPTDPLNAIIVGNDYGAGDSNDVAPGSENRLWGSWWTTFDGGGSWQKSTLPGRFLDTGSTLWPAQFVGDLVVAFAADGTAYLAGIAHHRRHK